MAAFRAGGLVGALAIGLTWIAVSTHQHGAWSDVLWISLGIFWFGIFLVFVGEPRER